MGAVRGRRICQTVRVRMIFWSAVLAAAGLFWWFSGPRVDPDRLRVPPGFEVAQYAQVPGARSLAQGSAGTVFVGTRREGVVYALRDLDRDGVADSVYLLASGLRSPNGVAFRDGSLYVAEISRITRYDEIESRLANPPDPVVVREDFPTDGHHGWKFIRFGPDGRLYVPVGAPCNVCQPGGLYSAIHALDLEAGTREAVAFGVRNTVGFDWHPETGDLWFSDNGRDRMGDDVPPDELNRVSRPGQHFGFPYCHGRAVADPEFGQTRSCGEFEPPALELPAHVAPLGLRFYQGDMFPPQYHGRIFLAQHGSWNRSVPDGYRVITVTVADGEVVSSEVFADGWLVQGRSWGRPVDVAVLPDGALLISDDKAGVVYRVTYREDAGN